MKARAKTYVGTSEQAEKKSINMETTLGSTLQIMLSIQSKKRVRVL